MRIAAPSLLTSFVSALVAVTTTVSAAEPQFRPEKFFDGHTRSTGIFRNMVGKPEQRFTTDCRGRTRGRTLYLDQRFRYEDGRTQERRWQIRQVDATHYIGRANDVVGEARGKVTGSSFRLVYTVALKPGNPLSNVRLDQTMTLRRDGTVENHATIRKLGIPLSRVTEQFRRVD